MEVTTKYALDLTHNVVTTLDKLENSVDYVKGVAGNHADFIDDQQFDL
jgi:hypothetical protein